MPAKAGIQYSEAFSKEPRRRGVLDHPLSRMMTSAPNQRLFTASRIPAVAVLVFLAGAAGTVFVAADLAPARRILGIAVGGGRGHQRGTGERQFVLAGIGIALVRFHGRQ